MVLFMGSKATQGIQGTLSASLQLIHRLSHVRLFSVSIYTYCLRVILWFFAICSLCLHQFICFLILRLIVMWGLQWMKSALLPRFVGFECVFIQYIWNDNWFWFVGFCGVCGLSPNLLIFCFFLFFFFCWFLLFIWEVADGFLRAFEWDVAF